MSVFSPFVMVIRQLYHPDSFDFMPQNDQLFFNSEQDHLFIVEQV